MKTWWLWLLGWLAVGGLAAAQDGPAVRLHVVSVPPTPQVWRLEGAARVMLVPEPTAATTVLLPQPTGGWKKPVVLELSTPGYQPLRVEIAPERLAGTHFLRLPDDKSGFYRFTPIRHTILVHCQPSDASVMWLHRGGAEYLGLTGKPLALDLGRLTTGQSSITFQIQKPGYHPGTYTLTVSELLSKTEWGPVSLRPLFPGSFVIGWFSQHPALAWTFLLSLPVLALFLLWQIVKSARHPS